MNLTDDDVREILRLLDESPYDELNLETGRFKLTLQRGGAASWLPKGIAAGDLTRDPAPGSPAAEHERPPRAESGISGGDVLEIRPPMPGTFYRAPSPGAEPFTEVGSTVDHDTILGLVETMKLMNSVVAGCRGEVIEICAKNGSAVEEGDTLMRIRVAAGG